jgi:signal transduction histidine kinase
VADQGIGIDQKHQKMIFERFRRATSDTKYQGLGVGLFIVKQIIEAHGGKIDIKSSLNKGSTFTIEIPIREALANPVEEVNNIAAN